MSQDESRKFSEKDLYSEDVASSQCSEEEDTERESVTLESSQESVSIKRSSSIRSQETAVLNVFKNPNFSKRYNDLSLSKGSSSYGSRSFSGSLRKKSENTSSEIETEKSEEIGLHIFDQSSTESGSKIKSLDQPTSSICNLSETRLSSGSNIKKKSKEVSLTTVSKLTLQRSKVDQTDSKKSLKEKSSMYYKFQTPSQRLLALAAIENEEKSKAENFKKQNYFAYHHDKDEKDKVKALADLNISDTDLAEAKSSIVLESEVSPEKDREIKTYYQQLYFYVIFLCIITSVALNMVSSNMFYLTNFVTQLYFDTPNIRSNPPTGEMDHGKTLRQSRTFNDFWVFAESTMLEMFYWDYFYSDKDPVIHTSLDDRKMLYENQLLGIPRLRQVRVRNDSCSIYPSVKRFFNTCYNYYSVYHEETRPISYVMEDSMTATAWVYTEAEKLNTSFYWGDVSVYGGGGYFLDLSLEKNIARTQILELKKHLWLYRGTRAIFIDFTIYNSNANLFCVCKIVCEFPPVGGMVPYPDIRTLKLIRYISTKDFFMLGCEIITVLFTVYYTYYLIFTIRNQLTLFLFKMWNYVDVLILFLLYLEIPLNVSLFIKNADIIRQLPDRLEMYTEFEEAKKRQLAFNTVFAILTFFCWLKLFKFLTFSVNLLEYKKTLLRSLKDILGFIPIFLTIFTAFAILANLLFCDQVKNYSSVWLSFLALLQAFLGEFEYKPIEESNKILGPVFYILFVFFIFFVLLNVFIAIINDAYSTVKSEVIVDKPLAGKYFKRAFLNLSRCLCCNLGRKMQSKSSDKKLLILNELEETLKRAGFTEDEIRIFFTKYNIDVNSMLDSGTRRKIIEELELNRTQINERTHEIQIFSINRRIDTMNDRIKEIEQSMQPLIDKIDVLINRLK